MRYVCVVVVPVLFASALGDSHLFSASALEAREQRSYAPFPFARTLVRRDPSEHDGRGASQGTSSQAGASASDPPSIARISTASVHPEQPVRFEQTRLTEPAPEPPRPAYKSAPRGSGNVGGRRAMMRELGQLQTQLENHEAPLGMPVERIRGVLEHAPHNPAEAHRRWLQLAAEARAASGEGPGDSMRRKRLTREVREREALNRERDRLQGLHDRLAREDEEEREGHARMMRDVARMEAEAEQKRKEATKRAKNQRKYAKQKAQRGEQAKRKDAEGVGDVAAEAERETGRLGALQISSPRGEEPSREARLRRRFTQRKGDAKTS